MSTREEFEKWAVGEGWDTTRSTLGEQRFYRSLPVQYMWDAWQAATRVEREACAQVCEEGWNRGLGEKHRGDVFATAIRARGDQS